MSNVADAPVAEESGPRPFAHWMLREIHQQPETLAATLGQLVAGGAFLAEACAPLRQWLRKTQGELVIAASGSSRHAGQVAELWIEDHSGIAVDVEYASEYSHRAERALKTASVLVISQSGETADTLAALRKAKAMGVGTMAITNVPSSTMAREAEVSFPTLAGRERAIPATKSFTAQLLNLYMLALLAAETSGGLVREALQLELTRLEGLPELVRTQLPGWMQTVKAAADQFRGKRNFLFLGRGVHYPIAREGALKLKESSYLNAEGYPSGELKHGPNALVSDETPLVILATADSGDAGSVERYRRVLQLMAELKQQGATMLAVANADDAAVARLAQAVIPVEGTGEACLVITEVIALQLFAYFMAVGNGIDVDHPRNLSKAVLTE